MLPVPDVKVVTESVPTVVVVPDSPDMVKPDGYLNITIPDPP